MSLTATDDTANRDALTTFADNLLRHAPRGGYLPFRVVDRRGLLFSQSILSGLPIDKIVDSAIKYGEVARRHRAILCSPMATFDHYWLARAENVQHGLTMSVYLNKGNTYAQRETLERAYGPATLCVAREVNADGLPKLEAHWAIAPPSLNPKEHEELRQWRRKAAHLVGGEPSGCALTHLWALPGTWPVGLDETIRVEIVP